MLALDPSLYIPVDNFKKVTEFFNSLYMYIIHTKPEPWKVCENMW